MIFLDCFNGMQKTQNEPALTFVKGSIIGLRFAIFRFIPMSKNNGHDHKFSISFLKVGKCSSSKNQMKLVF